MNKKIVTLYFTALVILIFQTGLCQNTVGWQKSGETLKFHANDLYGRIDGGAELFLEFGFEELDIDAYIMGEEEIEIELYRMSSPESALGIYLMKCGVEKPSQLIKARNTFSNYQITTLKNNYFIQVNNFSGQKDFWSDLIAILNNYLEEIPNDTSRAIFDQLPKEGLIAGSEKLVRGQYGLQPVYTLGTGDILRLDNRTFALVGKYLDKDDSLYTRIYVPYVNDKIAGGVYENIKQNLDLYIQVLKSDAAQIIFKDYRNKFGIIRLQNNVIDIKVNLTKEPAL